MSLYTTNQKIGIELELYCNSGVSGLRTHISSNNIRGFDVCSDGSLNNNGAEIKFDRGVELREAEQRVIDLHQIATNTTSLNTHFSMGGNSADYTGPRVSNVLDNSTGETGFHIHFGVKPSYTAIELIKLIKNTSDKYNTIRQQAWRTGKRWGGVPLYHMDRLVRNIHYSISNKNLNIRQAHRFDMYTEKYTGLNICNMYDGGRNTVEFRFAHGALFTDIDATNQYIGTLNDIFTDSFNDETASTLEWDGLTFTAIGGPTRAGDKKYFKISDTRTGRELSYNYLKL